MVGEWHLSLIHIMMILRIQTTTWPHLPWGSNLIIIPDCCRASSQDGGEYLTTLREFHKTTGSNARRIRVGEIVLIHNDGPRIHWRMGAVDSLITGNDGLVRAANVWIGNYTTFRPITRLYPLEVSTPTELESAPTESEVYNHDDSSTSLPRKTEPMIRPPRRAAALRAVSWLSEWTRELRRPPEDVEN